jgi:hypothetical protein
MLQREAQSGRAERWELLASWRTVFVDGKDMQFQDSALSWVNILFQQYLNRELKNEELVKLCLSKTRKDLSRRELYCSPNSSFDALSRCSSLCGVPLVCLIHERGDSYPQSMEGSPVFFPL